MRLSKLKSNISNICYDVFLRNFMSFKAYITAVISKWSYGFDSQGRVRTAIKRGGQFCCKFLSVSVHQ